MKIFITTLFLFQFSFSSVVQDYIKELKQEVQKTNPTFKEFDFKRGEQIFTSKHMGKKSKMISCTSCHNTNLNQSGKHFFTGKIIEALSPKVNPKRLTSKKQIKKWLKRNFKDVYQREGTALEKGDVLTYIINSHISFYIISI